MVTDRDRFAAAALMAERLYEWAFTRNLRRREAVEDEPKWVVFLDSNGGLYTEAPDLFPGPRNRWGR